MTVLLICANEKCKDFLDFYEDKFETCSVCKSPLKGLTKHEYDILKQKFARRFKGSGYKVTLDNVGYKLNKLGGTWQKETAPHICKDETCHDPDMEYEKARDRKILKY